MTLLSGKEPDLPKDPKRPRRRHVTRSITALSVVLNDKLTSADHVSFLMASCSSSLYATLCEYFVIMEYLQTLYKTYIVLLFSPKLHTVLVRGQASARPTILRDWTHSCDAASVMDTVLTTHLR